MTTSGFEQVMHFNIELANHLLTARRHMFRNIVPISIALLSLVSLAPPAQAGFWEETFDSIRNEVDNCLSGGCDPTTVTPEDVIRTTTGARAVGAAFDRWLGRQVRIYSQEYEELKQSLRQYINENYTCMQVLPETAGLCENLNDLYGLNMPIRNYYWTDLLNQYSVGDVEFLQQCVAEYGLPFDNPDTWGCLPIGEYF
ncbi:hypothetical protein [Phormidium sp. FACHB-1136]|uniref:hypothetical protein n=1 Tax=Phormidium sp. FACHB-1136 TaxID=2692848 RepID=UPI0016885E68|nr:hypothetical protein [Phormidium sp. FACHB-1136]MBD2428571.1 hypothetical protein [Phormidium sp. FACHB-1136]